MKSEVGRQRGTCTVESDDGGSRRRAPQRRRKRPMSTAVEETGDVETSGEETVR
jgi:hypothetical protein